MSWVLALGWMGLAALEQDRFDFRVEVKQVYVDVYVSRDGRALTGLTAQNFEVYDDDRPQDFQLIDASSVPRSIALVVDRSLSISGRKQEFLQRALEAFVGGLRADDELAVLTFAERTVLDQPLAFGRPASQPIRLDTDKGLATALNDAIFLSLGYLRAARGRPTLVLFTDGEDNASWVGTEMLLEAARRSEVALYAIRSGARAAPQQVPRRQNAPGVSDGNGLLLEELAELTGGRLVTAERPEEWTETYRAILSEMSTRYLLVFTPSAPSHHRWHRLRVRVKGASDAEVRSRPGYVIQPD